MTVVHASAVSRNGRGALIRGASGSGKSGLALSLVALGADLVADDAVRLGNWPDRVDLLPIPHMAGLIEARGVGLIAVNSVEKAQLNIVIDMEKEPVSRLPKLVSTSYFGHEFPLIHGEGVSNLAAVVWCVLGGGRILPVD